jgi:uncharacterized membrane protein YqhA
MTIKSRSTRAKMAPEMVPKFGWGWLILGILLIAALTVFGIAVFTTMFNVVSEVFGGPTIDMWQGFAMWVLLWMMAGLFRVAIRS